ncbi:hypothetical protein AU359_01102 [Micrococcus luteus]|nr:hypothetical protein AU359_01102 [Micrococcus luteus]
MQGYRVRGPQSGLHHHAAHPAHGRGQRVRQLVPQRVGVGLEVRDELLGHVRGGHEVLAHGLGQRLDEGGDELDPQAGDQPREGAGGDLVEQQDRHGHGHAVGAGRAGRVERVLEVELHVAAGHRIRERGGERVGVQVLGVGGEQGGDVEVQQVRLLLARLLPPRVEVPLGDDVSRDPRVVEGEQVLVPDPQVAAAQARLEGVDLLERGPVAGEEPVARAPVALHEGVPDEQLAGELRVDPAVPDRAVRDQGDAEQRHLLARDDGTRPPRPVRLVVGPLDEVAGDLLGPLRLDPGHRARPQPGGLHELGGHDERVALLEQGGAGEHGEAGAAGARVLATALVVGADLREQAREQGLVHRLVPAHRVHGSGLDGEAHVLGELAQLAHQVLPLLHAQPVDVLTAAQLAELGAGELLLPLAQVRPQVQDRGEVRVLVREPAVQLVRGLTLLRGALAGVLDGQGRGDHHDLPDAAALTGLEDHATQPRVHRQTGQAASDPGDGARAGTAGLERAEFGERGGAVGDLTAVRRLDEGELLDIARGAGHAEGEHLQDHRGQGGAQDLRVRELGAGEVVLLRVQADRDAVRGAAGPARALVRAGLGDALDRQALDLGAVGVPRDARGARVDHVLDARHGQGGLGDVRGQHDPPAHPGPGAAEHAVLLRHGQATEQRQDLRAGQARGAGDDAGQVVRGLADLPLARQEHEDVARRLGGQLEDGVADRVEGVAGLGGVVRVVLGVVRGGLVGQRPIANLDGVGAPRDLDDRRRDHAAAVVGLHGVRMVLALGQGAAEVPGEALRVDGGRGDDHLQVRALGQQVAQVAQEEVDVEAALVGLVHDDHGVAAQLRVVGNLGQEDAVRHDLDPGGLRGLRREADLVADRLSDLLAQLLRDAFGHGAGGDAPGLGVADRADLPESEGQAHLRQLRGLARTGLARDDHHLVVADRGHDLLTALRHRQVFGERDRGAVVGRRGRLRGGRGGRGSLRHDGLHPRRAGARADPAGTDPGLGLRVRM